MLTLNVIQTTIIPFHTYFKSHYENYYKEIQPLYKIKLSVHLEVILLNLKFRFSLQINRQSIF